MKRVALVLCAALLVVPWTAHAAKVRVSWTNPSTNTDGSPLTNLASVTVEWGACVAGALGPVQNSVTVPTSAPGVPLSTFAFPVGLAPACIDAYATNSAGIRSAASNVAQWTPPAALGTPEQLGVVLHFGKRKTV